MSEQDNAKIVGEIYAAFGRGDLPFVLSKLAEDVVWRHPRPADIPWGGERRGRVAVAGFFAAFGEHLEVEQFTPGRVIAREEQVIVLGHERMRATNTGKAYEVDWVHAWTLRGGQVAEFREYTDTATIIEALTHRK